MKRIIVDMIDPVLAPGATKTVIVPVTVKPAGMACEIEVFLGPNSTTKIVTSGRKPFTSTGASQNVTCPVTMPTEGGAAYHVFIDVYTGGFLFLAGKATEDVVIPGGSIGPVTWA